MPQLGVMRNQKDRIAAFRFFVGVLCAGCAAENVTDEVRKKLQQETPIFYWAYETGYGRHLSDARKSGVRFALWEDGSALIKIQDSYDYRFGRTRVTDSTRIRALAKEVLSTNIDSVILDSPVVKACASCDGKWSEWVFSENFMGSFPARLSALERVQLDEERVIRLLDLPRLPTEWCVRGSWELPFAQPPK